MMLKLHWAPDNANLPVRIALEMFRLPFEAVRVDRANGQHRSAAYREKNPQGLIPVLEDGDCVMFETGAILWYLAEKAGRLGPSGPKFADDYARSTVLKWLFYLSNTVHADLRAAFYADRYIDDGATELLRAGISRRMNDHFDMLEEYVYDRIVGHPTILPDIYCGVLARWAQLYPRNNPVLPGIEKWPTLQAMCARVESHPGAIKAFMAESIPAEQALTVPRAPELPAADVTGA